MMIECPKCGFAQPKDKFCAKCGVDVDLFEPQKPPIYKRILKSTAFQLVVVVGLISTIPPIYYRQSQKPEPRYQQVESREMTQQTARPIPAKTSKILSEKAIPPQGKPMTLNATTAKKQGEGSATNPLLKEIPDPMKPTLKSTQNPNQAGNTKVPQKILAKVPSSKKSKATKVKVQFAEAPRTSLNEIIFNNNSLGEDEYLRGGSYKLRGQEFRQMAKKISGMKELPGGRSSTLPISRDNPMTFLFTPSGEEEQEYGLQLKVLPQLTSGQLTVKLEGEMNLKLASEESSEAMTSSFQSSYTLPQSEVLFIDLALPNQPIDEAHMHSLVQTPLRIMDKRRIDVLRGHTTLVIIVQIR